MYAEISAAIASLKALIEIVNASKELRDSSELSAAVSEVNIKLLHVSGVALAGQEKEAALSKRITELENQLREIENFESEAARYVLHELTPGLFAYAVKPEHERGEPPHMLCANCMAQRQKSILQRSNRRYDCHKCKSSIIVPM